MRIPFGQGRAAAIAGIIIMALMIEGAIAVVIDDAWLWGLLALFIVCLFSGSRGRLSWSSGRRPWQELWWWEDFFGTKESNSSDEQSVLPLATVAYKDVQPIPLTPAPPRRTIAAVLTTPCLWRTPPPTVGGFSTPALRRESANTRPFGEISGPDLLPVVSSRHQRRSLASRRE